MADRVLPEGGIDDWSGIGKVTRRAEVGLKLGLAVPAYDPEALNPARLLTPIGVNDTMLRAFLESPTGLIREDAVGYDVH